MSILAAAPSVSDVTFPHPAWRYLLLFQSWQQLRSWGLRVLVALVLVNYLLTFANAGLRHAVLAGAVLGSLPSVVMALPTRFVVSACPDRVVRTLASELEALGYVSQGSRAGVALYRQNLPRLLRWDERNVRIERAGDRLIVTGPFMILKKARRFLLHRVIV